MNGYRFRFYVDGFNVYHAVLKTCPQYLFRGQRPCARH